MINILFVDIKRQYIVFECMMGCKEVLHQRRNEPRREKTGLRGFRPGPTQTGLYKLRKELEA